ncbi:putative Ig domain-containing protein [bacterium]|nr:putative Ig domain-containing protein [bacterium]
MQRDLWIKMSVLVSVCVLAFLLVSCPDDDDDSTIWIFTSELPGGRVLMSYTVTLEVRDADGTVTWSIQTGTLPPGLQLETNGVLHGQPTDHGYYQFTVKASDGHDSATKELAIDIPPVVLMSGFGPFGNYETNPSIEALWPLNQTLYEGLDIRVIELPVLWDVSWSLLEAAIYLLKPTVLIGTGMAYADAMALETVAKNKQFGTDNNGVKRSNDPIYPDGPDTLPTGLPVNEMKTAMEQAGYPAVISNNAGTYLCNYIFYHIMYYTTYQTENEIVGGFIHVPPAPYQGTFTIEDITAAHQAGLKALVDWMESGTALSVPLTDTSAEPVYFPE